MTSTRSLISVASRALLAALIMAAFAGSVAAAAAPAAAPAVTVPLRPSRAVPAGQITIGDVALVTGKDTALVDQINSLAVGATPWPGNARRVTRRDLTTIMTRQEIAADSIAWDGAPACTVTVRVWRVTGQEIAAAARERLMALPALKDGDATVTLKETPHDLLAPVGDGQPTLDVVPDSLDQPWGRVRVLVRVKSGAQVHGTVPVYFQVACSRPVVVARRDIANGATLTADDVTVHTQELNGDGTDTAYCFALADVLGKKTSRPILSGLPVTATMVAEPLAMRKGEIVSVVVLSDHLHIVAKAVARADARVGDMAPVEVLMSGKLLTGKVTAAATVSLSM